MAAERLRLQSVFETIFSMEASTRRTQSQNEMKISSDVR